MGAGSVPITDLLPHGPEITVIDKLIVHDEKHSIALAEIRPGSVFFESTGVPAWAGIEYMAQTIAAHAGFEARLRGEPPALGLLLGTRAYETRVAEFPAGAVLRISAATREADGRFASFDCSIAMHEIVATAVLNLYRPDDESIGRVLRGRTRR
jgi:predicted hotdog family 3-hydroxylacyl-ACP dehydratase